MRDKEACAEEPVLLPNNQSITVREMVSFEIAKGIEKNVFVLSRAWDEINSHKMFFANLTIYPTEPLRGLRLFFFVPRS